jgi:hypothetical protein
MYSNIKFNENPSSGNRVVFHLAIHAAKLIVTFRNLRSAQNGEIWNPQLAAVDKKPELFVNRLWKWWIYMDNYRYLKSKFCEGLLYRCCKYRQWTRVRLWSSEISAPLTKHDRKFSVCNSVSTSIAGYFKKQCRYRPGMAQRVPGS